MLDRVLSDYVNQLREKREHWLKIGRHDVGVPLINLLFWQFTWHSEEYDRLRKEGNSCGEALGSVKEWKNGSDRRRNTKSTTMNGMRHWHLMAGSW